MQWPFPPLHFVYTSLLHCCRPSTSVVQDGMTAKSGACSQLLPASPQGHCFGHLLLRNLPDNRHKFTYESKNRGRFTADICRFGTNSCDAPMTVCVGKWCARTHAHNVCLTLTLTQTHIFTILTVVMHPMTQTIQITMHNTSCGHLACI